MRFSFDANVHMIDLFPKLLRRIEENLLTLSKQLGDKSCVMPVGLFLVVDEAHGGDAVAQELVKRAALLDRESGTIVDFYYLGWTQYANKSTFDIDQFDIWRKALSDVGVAKFDGNADLILVDAEASSDGPVLRFDRAIRIDLSGAIKRGDLESLGKFLADLVNAIREVGSDESQTTEDSVVIHVSDKLGLAYANASIIEYFLKRFGLFIGARRLANVAIRNLGPPVKLAELHAGYGWAQIGTRPTSHRGG